MKKKIIGIFVMTLMITTVLPITVANGNSPTTTETYYCTSSDGFIWVNSYVSYEHAQSAPNPYGEYMTGDVENSEDYMWVGQFKYFYAPFDWKIWRSYLFFDTSTLPDNCVITTAKIGLYGYADNSETDFNLQVQNGQPTYPHDPIQGGDYDKDHYDNSGNGGQLNTNGFSTNSYNYITLNSDGRSWISKTSTTKLCIRSDRDIDAIEPSSDPDENDEHVKFYSNEKGGSYRPKLIIEYSLNNPPNTPSSPDPYDGETNVHINQDLSWYCYDPDGDDLTYDVYFGTSSDPPLEASGITEKTYDPGTMSHDTKYYWKIKAIDELGATKTGPIWDFTTGTNNPPDPPSNPDPYDGETNVDINHNLYWDCSDPDGDSLYYDVFFDTINPPQQYEGGTLFEEWELEKLSPSTTYYWQIHACDDYETTEGPIWEFTTEANNPPDTPSTPSGPSSGFPDISYTYSTSTTDPDGDQVDYLFDWYDGVYTNWVGPYDSGETCTASHSWDSPGTYEVRVKAKDVYNDRSDWSSAKVVTIKEQNKWTIISYISSHKDYDEIYHQELLDFMKNVGSQNGIEILALFDGAANGDTKAYHILPGSLENIPLNNINSDWGDEVNMGNPQTLIDFSEYCIENYKAYNYMVFPSGRGYSWMGCMLDDAGDTPEYLIEIDELEAAIKSIYNKIGKKVDLLFFNSCLMNSIEIGYQLNSYVKYQVGGETSVVGQDWNYEIEEILQHMIDYPGNIPPKDLANYIIDHQQYLTDNPSYTMTCVSAIDRGKMSELVDKLDELIRHLESLVDGGYRSKIKTAREQSKYIYGPGPGETECLIDLQMFVGAVLGQLWEHDQHHILLCYEIKALISEPGGVVINEKHTDSADFCNGISIYFPEDMFGYDKKYENSDIDFLKNTRWDEFLKKYLGNAKDEVCVENLLWMGNSQMLSGLQSQSSSQQSTSPLLQQFSNAFPILRQLLEL